MDLRRQPGEILNQVFYRNRRIVIERSGEPVVAMIPVWEFEQMEARRQSAKARVLDIATEMGTAFEHAGLTEAELRTLIDQSIEDVRSQK